MRFVLGNRLMDKAGGTEVHLLTLGDELVRLGHEVVVYSPQLGPFADYVESRGVPVVDHLRKLPETCDVVFAQDGVVVYDLVDRYPEAYAVFRICGDVYDFQLPPQVDGVVDLAVVLSERYARVAEASAVKVPLLRLRTPIDVDRLVPLGRIRDQAERAVVLGNYDDRLEVIREAFGRCGIDVDRVGGQAQRYDLAVALEDADIVVAKSRAAMDAMACGRAVYVLDVFGGDGWVTPALYTVLEADHFAGQATDRVVGRDEIERDLADYDPAMGGANRDLILQHHRPREHVMALLAAIAERPALARPSGPVRELGRLTALQWSWESIARSTQAAYGAAHDRLTYLERATADAVAQSTEDRRRADALEQVAASPAGAAESELAVARSRIESLEAELKAVVGTRAWRLASFYWRWRDRLLAPFRRRPAAGVAPDDRDSVGRPST